MRAAVSCPFIHDNRMPAERAFYCCQHLSDELCRDDRIALQSYCRCLIIETSINLNSSCADLKQNTDAGPVRSMTPGNWYFNAVAVSWNQGDRSCDKQTVCRCRSLRRLNPRRPKSVSMNDCWKSGITIRSMFWEPMNLPEAITRELRVCTLQIFY